MQNLTTKKTKKPDKMAKRGKHLSRTDMHGLVASEKCVLHDLLVGKCKSKQWCTILHQ